MSKIDDLKRELAKEEAKEQTQIGIKQAKINKFCIGKCFKSVASHAFSTTIRYKMVHDYIRYSDGSIMYGENSPTLAAENVQIDYSRTGYIQQMGSLMHMASNSRVHIPIKKHYAKGVTIEPSARHDYNYFRPEKLNGNKDVYGEHHWWVECSLDEFVEVREKALEVNRTIAEEFKKYRNKKLNYERLIEVSSSEKKLLEELMNKIDNSKIQLKDYIRIAKQSAEFFQFSNNQLDELGQYSLTGNKGVNNHIVSGDDGTDYEPYTTKYILDSVRIDWKLVLYSIRTKLDSVVATSEDLESLSAVYNLYNWDVHYDGAYDVSFNGCILNKTTLGQVNSIIKKHLI